MNIKLTEMSPLHLPTLTLLLLTTLSALLPFTDAGGRTSPADFSQVCVTDTHAGEFPESQLTLANLDFYGDLTETDTLTTVGWNVTTVGTCDHSLTASSYDPSSASNAVTVDGIEEDFYSGGPNDPLYVETQLTCMCVDCMLNVSIIERIGGEVESVEYSCNETEQTRLFSYPPSDRYVIYAAVFGNSTEEQFINITRYRVYYYTNCPAIVFNLAEYPSSIPGLFPVNPTRCVANAEAADLSLLQAGCSDVSEWEQVSAGICQCSAGFEPNDNLTACGVCGERYFKSSVGNGPCQECGNNQVSLENREGCVCRVNYNGDNCNDCVADYFMFEGDCVACPSGSERGAGDGINSCSCTGNRVTAAADPTTSSPMVICDTCDVGYSRVSIKDPSGLCSLCASGYFMSGGRCESCPSGSGRTVDEDPASCICDGNLVTTGGSTTTTTLPCGISVRFSAASYTLSEEDSINLYIAAVPPSPESISVTLSSSNDFIQISENSLNLTSTASNVSFSITSRDDETALQEPRTYSVTFDTDSDVDKTMNTASIVITDDDVLVAEFEQTSYKFKEGVSGKVTVKLSTVAEVEVKVRVVGEISSTVNTKPSATSVGKINKVLTFAPGVTSNDVSLNISDDSEAGEDDEQYSLSLERVSPSDDDRFTVGGKTFIFIEDDDEEEEEEEEEEESAAFPLAGIIGVCVGGALLAVAAAAVCLVCLCIWRFSIMKRRGFYHTNEDSQTAPTMLRYSASLRSISSQNVVVVEGKHATQKENEFFV